MKRWSENTPAPAAHASLGRGAVAFVPYHRPTDTVDMTGIVVTKLAAKDARGIRKPRLSGAGGAQSTGAIVTTYGARDVLRGYAARGYR